MAARAGLFLTFEGPEGGGKTTQMDRLQGALRERGHTITRTREPGGDPVGDQVRDLLLNTDPDVLRPETELLLFAAARAQNVALVVRPALAAGHVVLCDRYTDSTLAYQGYARGLPLDVISLVNRFATGGLTPDHTFLLDLPPAVGLARQNPDHQDRLDRESLAFHERVRAGFLAVAAQEPSRFTRLDAARPFAALADEILRGVLALLAARPA